jgi:uncharacterized RDD family membrane protein YckC
MERRQVLERKTEEGVTFTLLLAGPITRFLAWALDLACVMGTLIVVNILLRVSAFVSLDLANALSTIAFFVLSVGYGIFLEWRFNGRTLGKYLFSLRVVDAGGLPLTLDQIVIRNLLRVVDLLPACYLIGGMAAIFSSKAQRLGDLGASTVVIFEEKTRAPDVSQIVSPKYNSLRLYPHIVGRLRRNVSEREGALALEALLRRNRLDALPRVELFAEIAARLKTVTPLPQEATEGISDEQLVRDVVDVIYNTAADRRDRETKSVAAPPPAASMD